MSPAEMTASGCTVGTDYPAPLESLFVWPSAAEKSGGGGSTTTGGGGGGGGGGKTKKGQRSRKRGRGKGQAGSDKLQ